MNAWPAIRDDYFSWLRTFPLLINIGATGETLEIIGPTETPIYLDATFWAERTTFAEANARRHLADADIDDIFDEVASVIDENLLRFDPLIAYYGKYFPDGDPTRIEIERQAAHSLKRDLAWAAIERATGEQEFFAALIPWYDRGRWPCGWTGAYPNGHLRVL